MEKEATRSWRRSTSEKPMPYTSNLLAPTTSRLKAWLPSSEWARLKCRFRRAVWRFEMNAGLRWTKDSRLPAWDSFESTLAIPHATDWDWSTHTVPTAHAPKALPPCQYPPVWTKHCTHSESFAVSRTEAALLLHRAARRPAGHYWVARMVCLCQQDLCGHTLQGVILAPTTSDWLKSANGLVLRRLQILREMQLDVDWVLIIIFIFQVLSSHFSEVDKQLNEHHDWAKLLDVKIFQHQLMSNATTCIDKRVAIKNSGI